MVAASVKPYRLQRKTTLFKGGFLLTQYVNAGYFVTEEVKGATLGNQHWVAVTGVNGNNVSMVDPASNQTDMWSAYEWSKSSQFNYFKAE